MKTALRFIALSLIGLALMQAAPAAAHGIHKPHGDAAGISVSPAKAEPMAGATVGGGFTLVNHKGQKVTEKSWPGKYKLVFFGFTSCPDTCPVTLQKIAAVIDKIDPKAQKLAPLFITVDPEVDTPKVMAAYVANFNPHIIGLTGTQKQIDAAVNVYKVYASKQAGSANVDHSAYVYLMSPDDQLLQTFSVDDEAGVMADKIKESVK